MRIFITGIFMISIPYGLKSLLKNLIFRILLILLGFDDHFFEHNLILLNI